MHPFRVSIFAPKILSYCKHFLVLSGNNHPTTGLYSPLRLQEAETHRISTKYARESGEVVGPTHWPPLPLSPSPGETPGTDFCSRLSRPQAHSAVGSIRNLQNLNGPIWNRTRDLEAYRVVPQLTAPPRI